MSIEIAFYPDDDGRVLDRVGADEEALRREIKEQLGYWLHVCNVHTPDVRVHWIAGDSKDRATCEVDNEYDAIHFEFNIGRILAELTTDELFEEVCHEVAHILTWPLWRVAYQLVDRLSAENASAGELKKWRDDIEDAGERSTTFVHRSLLRAWKVGQDNVEDVP